MDAFGDPHKSLGMRAYVRRMAIATAVYVLPLAVSTYLPAELAAKPWFHYPILILPMIGMCGFFYALRGLVIDMTDEYQRAITVDSYLTTTWLTLCLCGIYGFLQDNHYVALVPLFFAPITWFACFGIVSFWVRWLAGSFKRGDT